MTQDNQNAAHDVAQDVGRFQCGIAAVIWHPETQKYLLLRRAERRDFGAGAWECVTGRVSNGETFEQGLLREVREELNVDVNIEFIIGTTHLYRGAALAENEILGVKYLCSIKDMDSITVSDEHDAHQWMTADEVFAFLPPAHWLYETILVAEDLIKLSPPDVLTVLKHASNPQSDIGDTGEDD